MSDTKRKNRIYTIISIGIIILSAVMTAFVYRTPRRRLVESCRDFGTSVAYFFTYLFQGRYAAAGKEVPEITATVAQFPDVQSYVDYIGIDIGLIFQSISEFLTEFFDIFNFLDYNKFLLSRLIIYLLLSTVFIPLGYVVLKVILDCYFAPKDDSLGDKSPFYRGFVFLLRKVKIVYLCVLDFLGYAMSKKYFVIPFVLVWLVNFGVLCFIPDFLAFYLYFLPSRNVASFGYMLIRFLINILVIIKSVPILLVLAIIAVAYHNYHRNIALDVLRHNEAKNCGLIKELEYVILITGEVGKGKTTLLTDLVLSLVNIFKTDALKTLYKIDLYFPGFDFSSFRALLISKIEDHSVFCLPDVDDVVNELFERYRETSDVSVLWGYEFDLFGDTVNLGNRKLSLKQALITYGRAFLIYYNNNPTVANYSIRFKGEFDDSPFLKLWDGDFFKTDGESYYAHVLDSDIMRFGTKVDPNGKFNGSFGYGIWVKTEAAKSYGNHISNSGYDRNSEECNPLNDLVEFSAMMGRHPNAMVDNKVYFRFPMDEQRASDLTAKIRELCSIISIQEKSDLKLAITGYGWLFALRDKLEGFEKAHAEYNNARADFTLGFMLPKLFVSYARLFCERLENVYGYRELTLIKEGGTAYSSHDGVKKEPKTLTWYQANMKVYGDVFASDCYSSFFTEMQQTCGYGIMDIPTYDSLHPTMEQYEMQKDHFIMKMMKTMMCKMYGVEEENAVNQNKNSADDIYAGLIFDE